MTYVDPRANNYYQNGHGRSSANAPLDGRLLWSWLRDPARRRDGEVPVASDLRSTFELLDPHFGADLVVR
jgi:4-hydroxyacetophenone monooxygenase